MIELSVIPEEVREMVLEATEKYSDELWREITSGWSPFYLDLVRFFRKMGEEQRRESLLKKDTDFQELAGTDDMELTIAIFCLSDETLDRVIANFPKIH